MNERSGEITLVPGKSDQQKADEYRDEIRAALTSVCEIMGRARRDGLVVTFNLGLDGFGRDQIANLQISKPL